MSFGLLQAFHVELENLHETLRQSTALKMGFGWKFRVGSQVRYETPKESRRMHRPKRCEY